MTAGWRAVTALSALILLTLPVAAAANQSAAEQAQQKRQELLSGEDPTLPGPGTTAQAIFGAVVDFVQGTAQLIGTTIGELFGQEQAQQD